MRDHPPSRRRTARALLVAVLVLGGGCARAGGQPFQPTSNTPILLESGTSVGQTLDPAGPVTGIDVNVATFGAPADPAGRLEVTLAPADDPRAAARAIVPGDVLADGAWVAATFDDPVQVDGTAVLEVTWTGATPIALWANTVQDGTTGIVNDPYAPGTLLVDDQPAAGDLAGDLAFRVSGGDPGDGIRQVGAIAADAAGTAVGDPSFLVLWGAGVLAAGAVVVVGLRTRRPPDRPPR